MTDTAELTLAERVAALEARLDPRATVPPITIGELANVPAPGSQIAAQWAQDVSGRIVHRFANRAALDGWAAPNGAFAVTLDDVALFRRKAGVWSRVTPYTAAATGIALIGIASNVFTQVVTLTIPTDTAPRLVDATWFLRYDQWPPNSRQARILIDNVNVAQWDWQQQPEVAPGDGLVRPYMANLTARNVAVAANKPIVVVGEVYSFPGASQQLTYADPVRNRLSISVVGA